MAVVNIYIHKGCNKALINDAIRSNGAGRIKFKARGVDQQTFILQALEGMHDQTILLLGFGVGPHWSYHAFDEEAFSLLKKKNCDQVQSLIELANKNRLNVISINPMKNHHPVTSREEIKPFGCTCLLKAGERTMCIGHDTKLIN